MPKLALTLACWDYDRTRPLMDGRVSPEGIDLDWVCLRPEETFTRQIKFQEFDISEFSLSYLVFLCSRQDWHYIGIPVFPSRMFRHSCIYINTNAGIHRPEDLIGKAVGLPTYPMTAAVWMRALLQSDYRVRPEQISWFYARENILPGTLPDGITIQRISQNRNLDTMLESGEIAALMTVRKPAAFVSGSPRVARLFPNFRSVEEDYFRRTNIFPIMHTVIVRREILEKHPWVATSLFNAFQQAKQLCYQDLYETDALKYSLPWLLDEVARTEQMMGKDFWPYGVSKNRHVIQTLVQYSHEQGLAARRIPVEDLFAHTTLELSSI